MDISKITDVKEAKAALLDILDERLDFNNKSNRVEVALRQKIAQLEAIMLAANLEKEPTA